MSKHLALIVVCAAAGVVAVLISTPVVGHDSWLHLIWLEQFTSLVRGGDLYPRWLPLSNAGFGSPTFYFYPPLAAFLASILALINSSASEVALFRFVGYIGTLGSIFSFRYYLRSLNVSNAMAWAGGMLYAMMPYRAVDLILRSALGEHLAFVWIPLVLTGIETLRSKDRQEQVKAFALVAVGFALIILSNIPTAVAMGMATPIYAFVRTSKSVKSTLASIAAMFVASLLSAIYLLPAISLQDQIQSHNLWAAGTSRTGQAYTLTDFFAGATSALVNANLLTLFAAVALAIIAWRATETKQNDRGVLLGLIAVISIAVVMQIPGVTSFLYHLPGISFMQFSWRWNIMLVPAMATLLVLLADQKRAMVSGVAAIFAVASIWIVAGFNAKYKTPPPTDVLKVEYSDASEYLPNAGPKSRRELSDFMRDHRTDPSVILEGRGTGSILSDDGSRRTYTFDLPGPTKATFHLFYWPHWQLEVNGSPIALVPDALGRATAELPGGRFDARLELSPHSSERTGVMISIIAGMSLAGVIAFRKMWIRSR